VFVGVLKLELEGCPCHYRSQTLLTLLEERIYFTMQPTLKLKMRMKNEKQQLNSLSVKNIFILFLIYSLCVLRNIPLVPGSIAVVILFKFLLCKLDTIVPQYLAMYCVPVSSIATRQHLRSAVCHQLAGYRLTASARMVVGLLQLPTRRRELTANTPSSCGEQHRCIWTIT